MNSCMMAFGWASIMLLIGVFLRARIKWFRNMLVPASVIAGILGIIFINIAAGMGVGIGTDFNMYNNIVNQMFTVSFISISLTSTAKNKDNTIKSTLRGALGLGLVWCLLYALTPLISVGIVAVTGAAFQMDPLYGMLIQFAFCQGPGQSATYGAIFEQYGWENAAMVAIAFSSIGFVVAFLVGVPAAKAGIKKGIAKHCGEIDTSTYRGFFTREEQPVSANNDTTCNSNIETLAFHFAIIGLCYVLAVGIAKILSYLPGFLGTSLNGLMFMNGMYAAYIVKFIMKKFKIDYLLDNTLQTKITGWTADYLVVCAFMAVSMSIISNWLVPILSVAVISTVITFAVCFYFGQRFGDSNDFERTLGLYGMCTGTVPSGLALVRIVDPNFQTSTGVELGACNLVMVVFCTPVYLMILACAAGSLNMTVTLLDLAGCAAIILITLKLCKCWGKKTFEWK